MSPANGLHRPRGRAVGQGLDRLPLAAAVQSAVVRFVVPQHVIRRTLSRFEGRVDDLEVLRQTPAVCPHEPVLVDGRGARAQRHGRVGPVQPVPHSSARLTSKL
jgi:hypothetical protein